MYIYVIHIHHIYIYISIFSRERHILHENFCCNRCFPVPWWRNIVIWFNPWKPKAIYNWTISGYIMWITSLDCFMMLLYMMMFICLVKSKCPHTVCMYAWKLMGGGVRADDRAFILMASTVSMLEKYHENDIVVCYTCATHGPCVRIMMHSLSDNNQMLLSLNSISIKFIISLLFPNIHVIWCKTLTFYRHIHIHCSD